MKIKASKVCIIIRAFLKNTLEYAQLCYFNKEKNPLYISPHIMKKIKSEDSGNRL